MGVFALDGSFPLPTSHFPLPTSNPFLLKQKNFLTIGFWDGLSSTRSKGGFSALKWQWQWQWQSYTIAVKFKIQNSTIQNSLCMTCLREGIESITTQGIVLFVYQHRLRWQPIFHTLKLNKNPNNRRPCPIAIEIAIAIDI